MSGKTNKKMSISLKCKMWIARLFQYLLYYLVPVKNNRIMFYAHERKGYVCNPAYIMQYMLEKCPEEFEIIWVSAWPESCISIPHVHVIGRRSFSYFRYFIRTKYFITNDMTDENLIKKRGQIFISTWHGGGAYKKVGIETTYEDISFAENFRKWYGRLDYFVSSCTKCTEIYSKAFGIDKQHFLEIGTPRNDLCFQDTHEIKRRVFEFYGLKEDTHLILYAPSFHMGEQTGEVWKTAQWEKVLGQLTGITGKPWRLVCRTHYLSEIAEKPEDWILDGNGYYDMQELLCAAELLVSDFSSSMWDFALMGKPVFLLKQSIFEYEKRDRGFFISPKEWPYVFIDKVEKIPTILTNLDYDTLRKQYQQHFEDMGSFEKGTACRDFTELLRTKI